MKPIICLLAWFASLMLHLGAAENLVEDAQVEKLATNPILRTGTFGEIIQVNQLRLEGECFSVADVMVSLKLPEGAGTIIESASIMRWSIVRVQVSKSYEIWIQSGFGGIGKERVRSASIIPHVEGKLGHVLLDNESWGGRGLDKDGALVLPDLGN